LFIRGIGGFGYTGNSPTSIPEPLDRQPDLSTTEQTATNQAIFYRLCADLNPLHISPEMASQGGFERPILHGLCYFGYAGRSILSAICQNDVKKLKEISCRFTSHVFPGETLVTDMWQDGD